MSYEETYQFIVEKITKSILSKDIELRNKIFNCIMNWYFAKIDKDLKNAINEDNHLRIENILKEVDFICKKSDYNKIVFTYTTKEFDQFQDLNKDIFMKIYNYIVNKHYEFNDNKYDNYIEQINNIELKIPNILQNRFQQEKSECLLDLLYLKNKGNIYNYSFRTCGLLRDQGLL